ncbi:hypothetical protein BD779DRAFT_1497157 [Infundibulicybe gibba]|nr:hypothetical protein BD779DRAFT_1497157 [Infundibulicybe gibba]
MLVELRAFLPLATITLILSCTSLVRNRRMEDQPFFQAPDLSALFMRRDSTDIQRHYNNENNLVLLKIIMISPPNCQQTHIAMQSF